MSALELPVLYRDETVAKPSGWLVVRERNPQFLGGVQALMEATTAGGGPLAASDLDSQPQTHLRWSRCQGHPPSR